MYLTMAFVTDGDRFPMPCDHVLLPILLSFEVFEFTHMMHLCYDFGPAYLASCSF